MSRLPIHTRVHLTASGESSEAPFVLCPTDRRWATLEACRRCPDGTCIERSESAAVVTCAKKAVRWRDPRRAPIAEAMDPDVLTVDAGADVGDVAIALDERGVSVAIVVDEAAHPIGVCSRRDVERALSSGASPRADRWMTPFVITLIAEATVGDAIDLVVDRDLHHVPVLAHGRIVGIVSARGALRWLTQNMRKTRKARGALPPIR